MARLAEVDRSTVSLVLNDPDTRRVGVDAKRRILEAVDKLGYSPNAAARQLRSGHSGTFLMPFWSLPFGPNFDGVIEGMGEACERSGLMLLLHGSRTARGAAGARLWARLRPEILLTEASRLDAEAVSTLRNSGTRAILTLGSSPLDGVHGLTLDFGLPGRLAARRLATTGASELVAVMPLDPRLAGIAEARAQGFIAAALEGGFSPTVVRTASDGGELREWVRSLPRSGGRIGVFAYNDDYALRLLDAAGAAGIDVPRRLAVVGVDNLSAGATATPPLTTLFFDIKEFGAALVAAGIAVADGQDDIPVPGFDYRMMERDSG